MTRGPAGRPWRFDVLLSDTESRAPRHEQLARAIVRDIRRGRLVAGAFLPGSRTLAEGLGVNRKVVVRALDELVAQGWLVAVPARGTQVSSTLPELAVADAQVRRSPASTTTAAPPRSRLRLDDGVPDSRLAPLAALARAYRRAMLSLGRSGLSHAAPAGDPVLREVLTAFLNQARGLACSADQLIVTRGSQMALALTGLSLCRPGDQVVVETPGYVPAWDAFKFAGAELVHVPVDEDGLDTAALKRALARSAARIRLVYVTPHHQYPTTVALAPNRRLELLGLAEKHGFTIVEDDYDYEYHFGARPLLPLAATGGLERVAYVGSLSKLIAPAVRVGYLIAGREVIERAASCRALLDRQGDVVLERAVAELIEDGELQRHARKARRAYEQRRDAMLSSIRGDLRLGRVIDTEVPAGGLALWLRVADGIDINRWSQSAEQNGLELTPGSRHLARGSVQAFRAGFASLDEREMVAAVKILSESLPL